MDKIQAFYVLKDISVNACKAINQFSVKVLVTRGGRIGSGMGMLVESLWGYYVNQEIIKNSVVEFEIAWIANHQYNDFVCLERDMDWDPNTHTGEIFRIEAKSMNVDAEESKGHFDVLSKDLDETDLLLVLIWKWLRLDARHFCPYIVDHFIGPALSIAELRDALHLARGGTFVSKLKCPNECSPENCVHDGEPLNAMGKRERISGPDKCRPSIKVSYSANFGGLLRMLKTSNFNSKSVVRKIIKNNKIANEYVSFIHRNFPSSEEFHYSIREWKSVAESEGLVTKGMSRAQIIALVREKVSKYREKLQNLDF